MAIERRDPRQPVPPVIKDLRDAMERVRQAQERTGILPLSAARYEAETSDINKEFLKEFLDILPVKPLKDKYSNYVQGIGVGDPSEVRIVTSLGVHFNTNRNPFPGSTYDESPTYSPSFVIGESPSPVGSEFKNILTAGWSIINKSAPPDKSHVVPSVNRYVVLEETWTALRERAMGQLTAPYSKYTLMSIFDSNTGLFIVGEELLNMPRAERTYFSENLNRSIKRLKRSSGLRKNQLRSYRIGDQELRSSDFEEYDVMTHLEYLAAAFGVGDQFDDIKARREEKMPPHPAETLFELPDYRRAIEQPGSQAPIVYPKDS